MLVFVWTETTESEQVKLENSQPVILSLIAWYVSHIVVAPWTSCRGVKNALQTRMSYELNLLIPCEINPRQSLIFKLNLFKSLPLTFVQSSLIRNPRDRWEEEES